MKTAEIQRRWLKFFEDRGHTIVPSASLVSDDATLMFTVAGMVPFVPYLTGVVPAPYPRATSVQKCIRTNDIEEVGKTPRHGTFFQMCGNFSFGDYFKKGAISFAWELLTLPEEEGGFGFKPEDLWVTVYEEDDEAFDLWLEVTGGELPAERIQRLGKETNYWSMGQPGPAGPCSEIFYDRGKDYGPDGGPATDHDRYLEIWNLVFMEFQIDNVRSKTEFDTVGELPKKNIDTGLGVERVAFIKQGVDNMYEIDQVYPVLQKAAELSGKAYRANAEDDVRLRVIADHVRSGLMLVSDGVTPSNEGRGYILRRLLRRVTLSLRLLGVEGAVFRELFTTSYEAMRDGYPELDKNIDFILQTVCAEESTFLRTLGAGMSILDGAVAEAERASERIPGATAFLLHDTHGFPIELTLEIAESAGVSVDRDTFAQLMREQKERAKADARAKRGARADLTVYQQFRALGETRFVGYSELEHESRVLGILKDGVSVQSAAEGETVELILEETSLWAESGGQDSDQGVIFGKNFRAEVLDVQKPVQGLIAHTVRVTSGVVNVDAQATTSVDESYRFAAAQAHSATHVIHAALRDVLGSQAHQSGSYNRAGYMRLDFTHSQPLSQAAKTELEEIANRAVLADYEVVTRQMPIAEAKAMGAMALFGEKYGDIVRVVDIGGPWSRELCAGTHVKNSAQIGVINLVSESSVGSSNRRVEALVGLDALKQFAAERALVSELSTNLRVPKESLVERISELSEQLKQAEKTIAALEKEKLLANIPAMVQKAERVGEFTLVCEQLGEGFGGGDLRSLALALREQLSQECAVVALFGLSQGRPAVVVATTASAREQGVSAGECVREITAILGGKGGGKADIAQGGGSDANAIAAAVQKLRTLLHKG